MRILAILIVCGIDRYKIRVSIEILQLHPFLPQMVNRVADLTSKWLALYFLASCQLIASRTRFSFPRHGTINFYYILSQHIHILYWSEVLLYFDFLALPLPAKGHSI